MYYPEDAVFVTGIAKAGKDDAVGVMYQNLSVSLIIDVHSNQILSISCSMVMPETSDFIRHLLVGKNLIEDMDWMSEIIRRQFLALSQKALIVALHDAQNRYLMSYPEARLKK